MCHITSSDPIYGSLITSLLHTEVPQPGLSMKDKLEAVSSVFMGTLQTRLGPIPVPEAQVAIRKIINDAFLGTNYNNIPVLVPFGPKKPGTFGVDVSELYAIKHLVDLHKRVREIYPPGLDVHVRLEDLTGLWLEGQEYKDQIESYCGTLEGLALALTEGESFLHIIRESELMEADEFFWNAKQAAPLFAEALSNMEKTGSAGAVMGQLVGLGWLGVIIPEMVTFYIKKYRAIYPDKTAEELFEVMGRYFAAALARRRLRGTGCQAPAIKLFFGPAPPTPYTEAMIQRRHIPLHSCKTHVIPWRSKGFFRISNEGIKPAQVPWHYYIELAPNELTFQATGQKPVVVEADYLLQE